MSDTRSGWVALGGRLIGNLEDWSMSYDWDGLFHPSKAHAIRAGFERYDHDDFNVGHVVHGCLAWFGWMDEQHPVEDYAAVAAQHGWTAPPTPADVGDPDASTNGPVQTPIYDRLLAEHLDRTHPTGGAPPEDVATASDHAGGGVRAP